MIYGWYAFWTCVYLHVSSYAMPGDDKNGCTGDAWAGGVRGRTIGEICHSSLSEECRILFVNERMDGIVIEIMMSDVAGWDRWYKSMRIDTRILDERWELVSERSDWDIFLLVGSLSFMEFVDARTEMCAIIVVTIYLRRMEMKEH